MGSVRLLLLLTLLRAVAVFALRVLGPALVRATVACLRDALWIVLRPRTTRLVTARLFVAHPNLHRSERLHECAQTRGRRRLFRLAFAAPARGRRDERQGFRFTSP